MISNSTIERRSASVAIFATLLIAAPCTAETIIIRLRPIAEVEQSAVYLMDVADMSLSSGKEVSDDLETVDLAMIPSNDRLVLIDKSMIDVRLRLLGLQKHEYRLLGPEQIVASRRTSRHDPRDGGKFSLISSTKEEPHFDSESITDLLIEREIQASLERQFDLTANDTKVRLLRSFVDERLRGHVLTEASRLEIVSPPDFPYGRTNLTVRLW